MDHVISEINVIPCHQKNNVEQKVLAFGSLISWLFDIDQVTDKAKCRYLFLEEINLI